VKTTVIRSGRIFGWVFAVATSVAAVWFVLIDRGVTVPDRPESIPGPWEHALGRFFNWFQTILVQERLDTGIAIVGFLALIGLALSLRAAFGGDRVAAVLGAAAVSLGSTLWITGNVIQLGGHRAVEILAEQGGSRSLDPVNSIGATIDTIDDWFELTAFAVIGIGILSFAAAALETAAFPRSWAAYSFTVAGASVLLSAAYLVENDLTDLVLLLSGIVLAPVWGAWSAQLLARLGSREERQAFRPTH
jgi:hypothetical protein